MKQLLQAAYWLFTSSLTLLLCLIPYQAVQAFQSTGYSRVIQQAEQIANIAFQKASMSSTVATAASAAASGGGAATAIRVVAGGLGWAGLGVAVGLTLYQIYYDSQKLQQIAQNAAPPGEFTVPGYTPSQPITALSPIPPNASGCSIPGFGGCGSSNDQYMSTGGWDSGTLNCKQPAPNAPPSGWSTWFCYFNVGWVSLHGAGGPNPGSRTSTPATPQQVQNYVQSLPASDPLSLENNKEVGGTSGSPSSAPAGSTTTVPQGSNQMQSTVVPSSQVQSTDIVVNPNAPAPAGTPQTTPKTQEVTTTTRTTTNPDGSVTTQDTEEASPTCAASGKGEATFASVLAAHQASWQSTGLLGTLTALKNIVWVETLPVISLPSQMFGTLTLDFSQWAWAFAAIKAIVIAGAGFAAYRIVFG